MARGDDEVALFNARRRRIIYTLVPLLKVAPACLFKSNINQKCCRILLCWETLFACALYHFGPSVLSG